MNNKADYALSRQPAVAVFESHSNHRERRMESARSVFLRDEEISREDHVSQHDSTLARLRRDIGRLEGDALSFGG
ncbi:MAG: hypothetical protein J0H75_02310, partial [Rhizobiales bacterium]|nr:hypothetical protein [Hyphomicrobiales bacterium]